MRTLSRPMFNMGGPIKQGIMHGIREPHQLGQIAGRVLPHIRKGWGAFRNIFGKTGPVTRTVPRQGPPYNIPGGSQYSKGYPGPRAPGKTIGPGSTEFTEQVFKPYAAIERDPIYKGLKWGKETLTGPTAKTWGKKILQGVATPTGGAALTWTGYQWLKSDGTPANKNEIAAQGKDQHGPFDHTDKKKIKKAQAAFAEAQRDTRVQKYLDMMGYDRSKKTAVADALIDASKIVSDRGTLEKKNITRDLINPIIQATSKRFDKPEQIREAVGLMSVKAAIQKDLEDPSIKELRMKNIEKINKELDTGVGSRLMAYMAAKKDKVKGAELEDFIRLSAADEKKRFKRIEQKEWEAVPNFETKSAEEIVSSITQEDGIYMIEDMVVEVTGGIPRQIK